jgi:hypothetical protein
MSILASAAWWQLFSPLRVVLFERNWWFSTSRHIVSTNAIGLHNQPLFVVRFRISRVSRSRFGIGLLWGMCNGFSRKIENHAAAVVQNWFAYNFIEIHRTLRTSSAMAAGLTDRLWDVAGLVTLWESYEQTAERVA